MGHINPLCDVPKFSPMSKFVTLKKNGRQICGHFFGAQGGLSGYCPFPLHWLGPVKHLKVPTRGTKFQCVPPFLWGGLKLKGAGLAAKVTPQKCFRQHIGQNTNARKKRVWGRQANVLFNSQSFLREPFVVAFPTSLHKGKAIKPRTLEIFWGKHLCAINAAERLLLSWDSKTGPLVCGTYTEAIRGESTPSCTGYQQYTGRGHHSFLGNTRATPM